MIWNGRMELSQNKRSYKGDGRRQMSSEVYGFLCLCTISHENKCFMNVQDLVMRRRRQMYVVRKVLESLKSLNVPNKWQGEGTTANTITPHMHDGWLGPFSYGRRESASAMIN